MKKINSKLKLMRVPNDLAGLIAEKIKKERRYSDIFFSENGELDFNSVSHSLILSEMLIEKYKDKLNWYYISRCQKLSEEFIEKNIDKIFWVQISIYQKLSEEFIEKHKDKVDWICLLRNKKIKLYDRFKLKYKLLGYIK